MGDVEVVVFDLDGTLIDSDEALVAPFLALGVNRERITFGHPIEEECRALGISVEDYVDAYDEAEARPFPGVEDLLAGLGRWWVCSNKHPLSARGELARLGWTPEHAWFTDRFGGRPKALGPMLEAYGVSAGRALFVGDTDHDRRAAEVAGVDFVWAGWNPRTASLRPSGRVLADPVGLLDLL